MRSTRLTRRAALALAALAATAAGVLAAGTAAASASSPATVRPATSTWTIENSPGTWRLSPSLSDNSSAAIGNGQLVDLNCYYYGAQAGPYGNTLWYWGRDRSTGTSGWINDHYLNTPGTAANPQPQTKHCMGAGGSIAIGNKFTAVLNSPGTWRNSPSLSDNSSLTIDNGQIVSLDCYYIGAPAGPYGNTVWYWATDSTQDRGGWINDHYLNTPGTAANPQLQAQRCNYGID